MKVSAVLFSALALFFVSLFSGGQLLAAESDPGAGTPTEIPPIAFVWEDLFGGSFDAGEDAMFIRSDLPASTSFGEGFELAVLSLDGEGGAVDEYDGAVFVEESRYPVETFAEQTGFMQGDYNGTTVTVQWRFWLDSVSGRVVNTAGESRIVAAYVYVVDLEGLGMYTDSGVKIENLIPMKRTLSMLAADDYAFVLAGLADPRADLQDCSDIDPADVCALGLCQCENRAADKEDDALAACDDWGAVSWGVGLGCGVPAAIAGGKAGARYGPWGLVIGVALGSCAGMLAGEITAQSYERGACRQRAQTQFGNDVRWAGNEFSDCNERVPPYYNCPIAAP